MKLSDTFVNIGGYKNTQQILQLYSNNIVVIVVGFEYCSCYYQITKVID